MLIVFDWDGTLVDSVGRIVSVLKIAATEMNLQLLPDQHYQNIIGLGLPEAVRRLYPHIDADRHIELQRLYSHHYALNDAEPCAFFDGVVEMLMTLRNDGHQLAVATGKSRAGLDRVLDRLDCRSWFASHRTADETASKPSPLMLQEIMVELDVPRREVVMVGDTDYDLQMANNAGVRAVAVTCGAHDKERLSQHNPAHIIEHARELIDIL